MEGKRLKELMLLEAQGSIRLAVKGFNIIISRRSSHGETTLVETYVARGLGPSRASRLKVFP